MYVCMYVCICLYIYVYMYIHTYIHTYILIDWHGGRAGVAVPGRTHIPMHTYISCVCVSVCMY